MADCFAKKGGASLFWGNMCDDALCGSCITSPSSFYASSFSALILRLPPSLSCYILFALCNGARFRPSPFGSVMACHVSFRLWCDCCGESAAWAAFAFWSGFSAAHDAPQKSDSRKEGRWASRRFPRVAELSISIPSVTRRVSRTRPRRDPRGS